MRTSIKPMSHRAWILRALRNDADISGRSTVWAIFDETRLKPEDAVNHLNEIRWLVKNKYLLMIGTATRVDNGTTVCLTRRGTTTADYLDKTTPEFFREDYLERMDNWQRDIMRASHMGMNCHGAAYRFFVTEGGVAPTDPICLKAYNRAKRDIKKSLKFAVPWIDAQVQDMNSRELTLLGKIVAALNEHGIKHFLSQDTINYMLLKKLSSD